MFHNRVFLYEEDVVNSANNDRTFSVHREKRVTIYLASPPTTCALQNTFLQRRNEVNAYQRSRSNLITVIVVNRNAARNLNFPKNNPTVCRRRRGKFRFASCFTLAPPHTPESIRTKRFSNIVVLPYVRVKQLY